MLGIGSRHGMVAQSRNDTLSASWAGAVFDSHTGVVRTEYFLEDCDSGRNWSLGARVGAPPAYALAFGNLAMQHNHRYRLVARAMNGVGAISDCAVDKVRCLLVDTSAPENASVGIVHSYVASRAARVRHRSWQGSRTRMHVSLRGLVDPESGLTIPPQWPLRVQVLAWPEARPVRSWLPLPH
eukprot:3651097-Prymnesium_polylepis.1